MGLPIPKINYRGPSTSAVVLADRDSEKFRLTGLNRALSKPGTEIHIFGKPVTRPYRRMAVALATAKNFVDARKIAKQAASAIQIDYQD